MEGGAVPQGECFWYVDIFLWWRQETRSIDVVKKGTIFLIFYLTCFLNIHVLNVINIGIHKITHWVEMKEKKNTSTGNAINQSLFYFLFLLLHTLSIW